MTPIPSVEEIFDSTRTKRASGGDLPTTFVDLAYTNRDPIHISEEESWEMKIPNKTLRCQPLPGAASPGIIRSSTSGASTHQHIYGIIGASAYIWDHRRISAWDHGSINVWDHWIISCGIARSSAGSSSIYLLTSPKHQLRHHRLVHQASCQLLQSCV